MSLALPSQKIPVNVCVCLCMSIPPYSRSLHLVSNVTIHVLVQDHAQNDLDDSDDFGDCVAATVTNGKVINMCVCVCVCVCVHVCVCMNVCHGICMYMYVCVIL